LNQSYCGGRIPPSAIEAIAWHSGVGATEFRQLWVETVKQH